VDLRTAIASSLSVALFCASTARAEEPTREPCEEAFIKRAWSTAPGDVRRLLASMQQDAKACKSLSSATLVRAVFLPKFIEQLRAKGGPTTDDADAMISIMMPAALTKGSDRANPTVADALLALGQFWIAGGGARPAIRSWPAGRAVLQYLVQNKDGGAGKLAWSGLAEPDRRLITGLVVPPPPCTADPAAVDAALATRVEALEAGQVAAGVAWCKTCPTEGVKRCTAKFVEGLAERAELLGQDDWLPYSGAARSTADLKAMWRALDRLLAAKRWNEAVAEATADEAVINARIVLSLFRKIMELVRPEQRAALSKAEVEALRSAAEAQKKTKDLEAQAEAAELLAWLDFAAVRPGGLSAWLGGKIDAPTKRERTRRAFLENDRLRVKGRIGDDDLKAIEKSITAVPVESRGTLMTFIAIERLRPGGMKALIDSMRARGVGLVEINGAPGAILVALSPPAIERLREKGKLRAEDLDAAEKATKQVLAKVGYSPVTASMGGQILGRIAKER
jgi:hypothetical protein